MTGIATEMWSEQKQFIPVAVGEHTGQQNQTLPMPALPPWGTYRAYVYL